MFYVRVTTTRKLFRDNMPCFSDFFLLGDEKSLADCAVLSSTVSCVPYSIDIVSYQLMSGALADVLI